MEIKTVYKFKRKKQNKSIYTQKWKANDTKTCKDSQFHSYYGELFYIIIYPDYQKHLTTLYLFSFEKRGTLICWNWWQECEVVQLLMKGNLTVSFKIAITLTLWLRNSTLGNTSYRYTNKCRKWPMCIILHRIPVHNSKILSTSQRPIYIEVSSDVFI